MTGSIDAVLAAGDADAPQFFIVDYKSNGLKDFSAEALRTSMSTHHYQLQALIYLVALHRFVRSRLGEAYDYDTHIAGAAYHFLRGMKPDVPGAGVVHLRPSRACIEDLSNLLNGDVHVA
jgi:exodeoxyribonuclease V beta subunit